MVYMVHFSSNVPAKRDNVPVIQNSEPVIHETTSVVQVFLLMQRNERRLSLNTRSHEA